ncbi:hypothetical protein CPSG_01384 [Coccidioides posadasii str. Silveira]|uniref:Uncharacterized protein n=1 Tax=Coccidioides posadasii (strain RMSCC 757 / Silveira) TaxID=443226 RepID=E9CV36_COCPS|nr:hypothetical protein CPSG_01384 [Coccidioides posadasii str. Silveira]
MVRIKDDKTFFSVGETHYLNPIKYWPSSHGRKVCRPDLEEIDMTLHSRNATTKFENDIPQIKEKSAIEVIFRQGSLYQDVLKTPALQRVGNIWQKPAFALEEQRPVKLLAHDFFILS